MDILMPKAVSTILTMLENSGHEAYIVGGCVRDSLLGLTPHDWDICTSATPDAIQACFAAHRTVPTGIQHGTVTVLFDETSYEVTTFRRDGAYTDGRHPKQVQFVSSLKADLARRDFTINAMAYHPMKQLIDPFGGAKDLQSGVLKAVGDAKQRFTEDALRIVRALRFAAKYSLTIEAQTRAAMRALAPNVQQVSKERRTDELLRTLAAPFPGKYFRQCTDILFALLPPLATCEGFLQNSLWHEHDVLTHILRAVDEVRFTQEMDETDFVTVRLAALLHDIAKPSCYHFGNDGHGHFKGHVQMGAEMASRILQEHLRLPKQMHATIVTLIAQHDADFVPSAKLVRRYLSRLGEKQLALLLALRKADILAHGENAVNYRKSQTVYENTLQFAALMKQITETEHCFTVKDLAVNGYDLENAGIQQGAAIGKTLRALLDMVLDARVPNEKAALLQAISAINLHDLQST